MNWSRRLAVALALSVGLNLVFAGIWIGSRFRHRHHYRESSHERGRFPSTLGKAMAERRPELAEQRRAAARARADAEAALAREPFDRAALDASLAELRRRTQASQELVHRAVGDAASTLPPERRRELGRALTHGRMGRKGSAPPRGLRDPRPDPSAD